MSAPISIGVLGPVNAWDAAGEPVALRGPRHRAVLARLVIARGEVVPVDRLVDDLWIAPPPGAVGAVRTFVAALRLALEPDRPPRAPARLLVTAGPGYALRAAPDAVDAWRFERAVQAAARLPAAEALAVTQAALGDWRGPAYADFAAEHWAGAERSRLAELRLRAVEQVAQARLDLGLAAEAIPDLDAHVAQHPWREDGWSLLALALYRSGRQGDALAVLRRARTLLIEQLGVDAGPALQQLQTDILDHAPHLTPVGPVAGVDAVWARAAAAYERAVAPGAPARLEATVGLLRELAVTGGGGLVEARRHRLAAVAAAEELGDPLLTARVIGAYDVPAIWTRSDDPDQAAAIVAAAERTLPRLPADGSGDALRARLLATIAVESRGTAAPRGPQAAAQAEALARGLDDPTLLAFALNGAFMQSCGRAGLAPHRAAIAAELVGLSQRHGLVSFEVLGHLIAMQAAGAAADFAAADRHAAAVDALAARHERPLAGVFTAWYRVLRAEATTQPPLDQAQAAYRAAAALLDDAGMPGLATGLLPLALLCTRVSRGLAADPRDAAAFGPYLPWAAPLLLLAQDRRADATAALRQAPDPPRDLLQEALWCLTAQAAIALHDAPALRRARAALAPAADELAGAGSGLVTLGPVRAMLDRIDAALARV